MHSEHGARRKIMAAVVIDVLLVLCTVSCEAGGRHVHGVWLTEVIHA